MKKYKSGDIIKYRTGEIGIYLGYTINRIPPIQGNLITVTYKNPEFGFNKFHQELWEDENCTIIGNTYDLVPEIGDYVFFIPKKKILKIEKFFFDTKPVLPQDGTIEQRCFIQEISYMILKEFYWDPNTPATMNDCVLLKTKDEIVTVVDEIYI
jgi:hypothetical protein